MNKYSAVKEIQRLAADVPIGVDERFVCPLCGGGSTNEKSLSVRRFHRVEASFCCYRASCDLGKGFVALYSDGEAVFGARSKPTTKYFDPKLFPLSEEGANLLRNKYHLDDKQIRYARIRHLMDKRFYIPVFSPAGRVRGAVLRKEPSIYCGKRESATIPKAWNLQKDENEPFACWYRRYRHKKKNSDTLIVVEDCLSALRCTPYSDSVALCGTNIPTKVLKEIREQGYEDIVLALDNDATGKAFKTVKNVSPLVSMRIMPLDKDIKNCSEEELDSLMGAYL